MSGSHEKCRVTISFHPPIPLYLCISIYYVYGNMYRGVAKAETGACTETTLECRLCIIVYKRIVLKINVGDVCEVEGAKREPIRINDKAHTSITISRVSVSPKRSNTSK